MGCSHFYEGLWSASPHFYEGLFDVLAHFYEGLLWLLLHFYEGLWAWGAPPSTPIAPGQRRLSSVLGLLALASAWGWLPSFFWAIGYCLGMAGYCLGMTGYCLMEISILS